MIQFERVLGVTAQAVVLGALIFLEVVTLVAEGGGAATVPHQRS